MGLKGGLRINKVDFKALNNKLNKIQEFPKEAKAILRHEANQAVGKMKRDAPVDTGRLRREITATRVSGDDIVIESIAIDPKTGEDYATIQEFGGRNIRPQPYFYHNIRVMLSELHKRLKYNLQKLTK